MKVEHLLKVLDLFCVWEEAFNKKEVRFKRPLALLVDGHILQCFCSCRASVIDK